MGLRNASDADLARRCRRGEAAAWRELVRRSTPRVYRLAWRMLRHDQEAEDATQETLMRVHRSFGTFDATRPLAPWVSRIAYNVCLRRIEKAKRRRAEQLDGAGQVEREASGDRSPEEEASQGEAVQLLEGALGELAAQDRALLALRYKEGLSDSEVAEATEMPVGTVKTRIFRARATLRRLLSPLMKEGRP